MSDTPRVEAEIERAFSYPAGTDDRAFTKAVTLLARQLERELAEARAQIDVAVDRVANLFANLARLEAELAEKEREHHATIDAAGELQEKLARAEAERDAAVKDAERYRYMRQRMRDGNVWQPINRAERLDEHIDAALKHEEGK
jgi:septal ring factor EnvC (AmiA/AmiB activator)